MRIIVALVCLMTLLACTFSLAAEQQLTELLDFEKGAENGKPAGWRGGPAANLHADSLVTHQGQWSCRLEQGLAAGNSFTALTHKITNEKQGKFITLRGFLKTEAVAGMAGLWMRLDSDEGMVGFDNMKRRNLKGTTEWTEYTIAMPYDPAATEIVFGALLSGQGKVWVDDLQLLVDGKPYDQAPALVREETALDTDTEFIAGSGVAITDLTSQQVWNLALLGKVWGFLKYHHPALTQGERHWDFELFRALPGVLAAGDNKQATGELLTWIDKLPEVSAKTIGVELETASAALPRLEWLKDEQLLGRALSRKLQHIYKNRPAGNKQFYISQHPGVGNPKFLHEPTYTDQGFPDAGYRLLALFRYWNIIEYWFPNRDIIDRDWDEVLAAYLPEVTAATDNAAYQLAMLRVIAEVDDGHANIYLADEFRPPAGKCRLPLVIRFVEDQAVVTAFVDSVRGPATGLEVGDVINKIDGNLVSDLIQNWEPYYPASNQPHRLSALARNLTRGPWGPCSVEAIRDGKAMTLPVQRTAPEAEDFRVGRTHDLPGDTFQMLGDEVAYLKLSSVVLTEAGSYVERAAGTKGLIIDIRNYPSSFMVFALGSRLVTERTPFVCFTTGDLNNPGAFVWSPDLFLDPVKPTYAGKVVILVDEASISQSEYTAMAFRAAPEAIIVGSTTAGADGNVSAISLPGGLKTNISGIGVFYPDHSPTQRVGILPDVEVRPSIEGIKQGRDEVLEEAIRQILGAKISDVEIRARYR